MPGHGGGAHVEPVLVVGSQLLPVVGLDEVHPLGHLHLARPGEGRVIRLLEELDALLGAGDHHGLAELEEVPAGGKVAM